MKKLNLQVMILTSLLSLFGCNNSKDPASWSSDKIDKWFEKGEWLNGWSVSPDKSINRKEFAITYFKNKERWDMAFDFLNTTDLTTIKMGRTDIDGDNLYVLPSEYLTKNREQANFEAHRKYIDIQYVVSGIEMIGISDISNKNEVLTPYDENKDIEFMTVSSDSEYIAQPDRFFVFFPSEAHRPSLKVDDNTNVRKVVVKVKID